MRFRSLSLMLLTVIAAAVALPIALTSAAPLFQDPRYIAQRQIPVCNAAASEYLAYSRSRGQWYCTATAPSLEASTVSTDKLATGVAAGYRVARGEVTLDGSNPTAAATGLTTVVQCTASLEATTAPAVTFLTTSISSTTLNLYAWAPTGAGNTALTASSNNALVVSWICVGT